MNLYTSTICNHMNIKQKKHISKFLQFFVKAIIKNTASQLTTIRYWALT